MSDADYRGFTFETYRPLTDDAPPVEAVRARRGRIQLFAQVHEGELPTGWTLHDVLKLEIDRLMDPKALRGVERLN